MQTGTDDVKSNFTWLSFFWTWLTDWSVTLTDVTCSYHVKLTWNFQPRSQGFFPHFNSDIRLRKQYKKNKIKTTIKNCKMPWDRGCATRYRHQAPIYCKTWCWFSLSSSCANMKRRHYWYNFAFISVWTKNYFLYFSSSFSNSLYLVTCYRIYTHVILWWLLTRFRYLNSLPR